MAKLWKFFGGSEKEKQGELSPEVQATEEVEAMLNQPSEGEDAGADQAGSWFASAGGWVSSILSSSSTHSDNSSTTAPDTIYNKDVITFRIPSESDNDYTEEERKVERKSDGTKGSTATQTSTVEYSHSEEESWEDLLPNTNNADSDTISYSEDTTLQILQGFYRNQNALQKVATTSNFTEEREGLYNSLIGAKTGFRTVHDLAQSGNYGQIKALIEEIKIKQIKFLIIEGIDNKEEVKAKHIKTLIKGIKEEESHPEEIRTLIKEIKGEGLKEQQLEALIREIQEGSDLEPPLISTVLGQPDNNGYLPLHFACKGGHKKVIKLLLGHMLPGDIQAQTNDKKDGYNALHFACQGSNDPEIFEWLSSHIDITLPARNGFTPLHCASISGNHKMAECILGAQGITIDHVTRYTRPLVLGTDLEISPNYIEKIGFNPLHLAAREGRLEAVKVLLRCPTLKDTKIPDNVVEDDFVFITEEDSTTSTQEPEDKTVIQNFTEQPTRDGNRHTALHLAARGGFADVIKELLGINPNLIMITDAEGNTPLHLVSIKGAMQVLVEEVALHPSFDMKNRDGNTPLHCTVQNTVQDNNPVPEAVKEPELVKMLLDSMKGFPTLIKKCHAPNYMGQTPLHLSRSDEVSKLLLSNLFKYQMGFITREAVGPEGKTQAEDNVDIKGNTVLHCASYNGLEKTIEFMFKNQSVIKTGFVNKLNQNGCAAIHLAKTDEVALLLLTQTKDNILTSSIGPAENELFSSKIYNNEHHGIKFMDESERESHKFAQGNILHIAVKKNFIETVKKLLSMDGVITQLVNGVDGYGNIPFHLISSDEMGQLLLPYITEEHLSKVNRTGQTILHKVVAKNLCSFVEELIKQDSNLLSKQDLNRAFPIDLAGTLEMVSILAGNSDKGLLKEAIGNYQGDSTRGIGLIITKLSPDLLRYALTCQKNMDTDSSDDGTTSCTILTRKAGTMSESELEEMPDTDYEDGFSFAREQKEKTEKEEGIPYLESEWLRLADILGSFSKINNLIYGEGIKQEQKSTKPLEFDDFEIIDGENIGKDTNLNEVLLQYANLSYALGYVQEATESYTQLFLEAPEYIARVLDHLSGSDKEYVKTLLAKMKEGRIAPWDGNLPDEGSFNLLYSLAYEGKTHVIKLLLKAEIDAQYFAQALGYAVGINQHQVVRTLLATLANSVSNDNALWETPTLLLKTSLKDHAVDRIDLFIECIPEEVVGYFPGNRFLHWAKDGDIVRKLVNKYPGIKNDSKLDSNQDTNYYCVPAITDLNCALQTWTPNQGDELPIHIQRGRIFELIGRTGKALECYKEAKKYLPKYYAQKDVPVPYDLGAVNFLLNAQIQDENIVPITLDLTADIRESLKDFPAKSQAIAYYISSDTGHWVNIFIAPREDEIKIFCPSTNIGTVTGAIMQVQKVMALEGLTNSIFYLDRLQGSPVLVVDNLVKIASLQGDFTKEAIEGVLGSEKDLHNLQIQHQLILERDSGCYSDLKFHMLLKFSLGNEAYITSTVNLQETLTSDNKTLTFVQKHISTGKYNKMVIPLHTRDGHWSSLVIKREGQKEISVIYSDATGNPFIMEENALGIISYLLQLANKVTITDLQIKQVGFNDKGCYAVENIVAIIHGEQVEEKLNSQEAQLKHLELLREAGIPVQTIDPDSGWVLAPPQREKVYTTAGSLDLAHEAYAKHEQVEAFKYFDRAIKFYQGNSSSIRIPADSKFNWLADDAPESCVLALLNAASDQLEGEATVNFTVIAIKQKLPPNCYAFLVGYQDRILKVIHLDAAGTLLTEKPVMMGIIGELLCAIPTCNVDMASKVKMIGMKSFEEILTALQQIECPFDQFNRDFLCSQKCIKGYLVSDLISESSSLSGDGSSTNSEDNV